MARRPASQTIASSRSIRPAASRAAARSAKRPNAVGPEPVSSASGAPASRRALERLADVRAKGARRRLEVVLEQLGVVERRGAGAGRGQQPLRQRLQLARRCGRARAGRPRRRPRRSRGRRRPAAGRPRAARGRAAARPSPPRRGPAPARGRAARGRRRRARRRAPRGPEPTPSLAGSRQAQDGGRVGRAAAQPGGDRDPLLDLDPQRRPAASPARAARRAPAPRGSRPRPPRRGPRRARPRRPRSRRRAPAARTASRARAARPRGAGRGRGRG